MLIPTPNRKLIHQYLFKEGVIVVKKDYHLPQHQEIPVPNLQVAKALQSLHSRDYVSLTFSWKYYYYILTEKGIEHLRRELNLPTSVVPATVAKALKTPTTLEERPFGRRSGRDEEKKKEAGASSEFKPQFVSCFYSSFSREEPLARPANKFLLVNK
ncbi:hypothetical protein DI09_78p40 [Mitosporidium daphniae]|uniref:Plectin/eS10 N-terminal domain-containing protein n=1 Tax=Mitosporidium daphniae TaxID=1485682 RepID=A0A098VMM3_9MICR|nr:uncharacterized protein DI09_78p40 [Mitosporidium daphniae]KGG50298.1 hypothetical protein DI09_78p40 [Mitosporidium daphniae]|eukprot:XP_013236741.1 uncharacterized protein DI09_78p40 [Mitosporidium daphniae]